MPKPSPSSAVMKFGKHAGTPMEDVPEDYLTWLIGNSKENILMCETELQRRKDVEEADQTMVERLVIEGYRSMVKKTHPDMGGNDAAFRAVQAAYEQLKIVLKELKTL